MNGLRGIRLSDSSTGQERLVLEIFTNFKRGMFKCQSEVSIRTMIKTCPRSHLATSSRGLFQDVGAGDTLYIVGARLEEHTGGTR